MGNSNSKKAAVEKAAAEKAAAAAMTKTITVCTENPDDIYYGETLLENTSTLTLSFQNTFSDVMSQYKADQANKLKTEKSKRIKKSSNDDSLSKEYIYQLIHLTHQFKENRKKFLENREKVFNLGFNYNNIRNIRNYDFCAKELKTIYKIVKDIVQNGREIIARNSTLTKEEIFTEIYNSIPDRPSVEFNSLKDILSKGGSFSIKLPLVEGYKIFTHFFEEDLFSIKPIHNIGEIILYAIKNTFDHYSTPFFISSSPPNLTNLKNFKLITIDKHVSCGLYENINKIIHEEIPEGFVEIEDLWNFTRTCSQSGRDSRKPFSPNYLRKHPKIHWSCVTNTIFLVLSANITVIKKNKHFKNFIQILHCGLDSGLIAFINSGNQLSYIEICLIVIDTINSSREKFLASIGDMLPAEKCFLEQLSSEYINALSLSISNTILIVYDKFKIEILTLYIIKDYLSLVNEYLSSLNSLKQYSDLYKSMYQDAIWKDINSGRKDS
jgi:hypothetical protein